MVLYMLARISAAAEVYSVHFWALFCSGLLCWDYIALAEELHNHKWPKCSAIHSHSMRLKYYISALFICVHLSMCKKPANLFTVDLHLSPSDELGGPLTKLNK